MIELTQIDFCKLARTVRKRAQMSPYSLIKTISIELKLTDDEFGEMRNYTLDQIKDAANGCYVEHNNGNLLWSIVLCLIESDVISLGLITKDFGIVEQVFTDHSIRRLSESNI